MLSVYLSEFINTSVNRICSSPIILTQLQTLGILLFSILSSTVVCWLALGCKFDLEFECKDTNESAINTNDIFERATRYTLDNVCKVVKDNENTIDDIKNQLKQHCLRLDVQSAEQKSIRKLVTEFQNRLDSLEYTSSE